MKDYHQTIDQSTIHEENEEDAKNNSAMMGGLSDSKANIFTLSESPVVNA